MAKVENQNMADSEIQTILAKDIQFTGKLKFSRTLKIMGKFEGEIIAPEGFLFIGEGAEINADVHVNHMNNSGKLTGETKVNECLILCEGAEINGNINVKELSVKQGGIINGLCTMPKR